MPASTPDAPTGRPKSPYLSGSVFGALAVTLLLAAVAIGLGVWQLGAWKQERELKATDRTTLAPVPIDEVMGPDDPLPGDAVGRPVALSGAWVPDSTVLVPHRSRGDEDGWWVATAVTPAGQDAALYVVRDFTTDPDQVPAEPSGAVQQTVWLEAGEAASPERDTDSSDNRITAMRTVELLHHVDGDLYSGFAVSDEEDLVPVSENSIWTGLQNFFYAFEWWVFGGFVVFIFGRFLWELRQRFWEQQAEQFGLGGAPTPETGSAAEREPDLVAAPAGTTPDAPAAQDATVAPALTPAADGTAAAAVAASAPPTALPVAEGPEPDLNGVAAPAAPVTLRERLNDVTGVLTRYRVMANIVGVLLIVILLIGIPLKYFTGGPMWGLLDSTPAWVSEGGTANQIGDWITHYLGVAHGWLYMIFLFAAFQLAMRCRWKLGFSVVVLLCGTIPILSFWAESRGVKAARRAFPEELGHQQPILQD